MSYTRWSNSSWYSFWSDGSGKTKESQVLALWYNMDLMKDWSYEELKDMDIADLTMAYPGVPHNDIVEAMNIVKMFLKDVEDEFTTT